MKNRKGFAVIAFLVVLIGFGTQSCSQYPDNDGITLLSRTDRLAQVWIVENYKLNDVDYTSLLSGYTETFTKDGDYSYQWTILGGTATWVFQNNYSEIKITGVMNQASKTLHVLKLEEKSFWYFYMDGSDKKEYHMISK
jgi:hypothetical protein